MKRPVTNIRNLASPMWCAALVRREGRAAVRLAGLWRPSEGGAHFAFVTCEANAVVGQIHPKAMPVILETSEQADRWLYADGAGAAGMQQPYPDAATTEIDLPDPPPAQASLF